MSHPRKFEATFAQYWDEGAFEPYDRDRFVQVIAARRTRNGMRWQWRREPAVLERPRPNLLGAGGEVGLESQQSIGLARQPVQARLLETEILEEGQLVFLIQLRDLRLDLSADDNYASILSLCAGFYSSDVR